MYAVTFLYYCEILFSRSKVARYIFSKPENLALMKSDNNKKNGWEGIYNI